MNMKGKIIWNGLDFHRTVEQCPKAYVACAM